MGQRAVGACESVDQYVYNDIFILFFMNDRKFLSDNIKAVILDFDGTVGNSRGLIVRTMQQTIRRLGLPERTEEECASMIGLPLKETFTRIIDMDDAMGDRCAEVYREIFKENNRPGVVSLFPNVRETLDAIHRSGRMITLASSRSRASLLGFVADMELGGYISYVLGAGDVPNAKPAPDMVVRTMKDHGLRPDECVVVGDTAFDIGMAHGAGVCGVGVTYGNGSREELEECGAEFVIDDFSQLCGILNING